MNIRNMLFRAASALLAVSCAGFGGCDESDPERFISVTRQDIEVEYTGLTAEGEMPSFELGANTSWKASYADEWIHLSHTEGDRGRMRIFLTVDENNTGEDREGFVVFEGDGPRKTVSVTQRLKIDELSVSPLRMTVVKSGLLESGDRASVYIATNSRWEIDVPADSRWITPSAVSGDPGNTTVLLSVEQNRTDAVRTGTFTVTAGSKQATVTLTQNLEGLKVSTKGFEVNKFGFIDEAQTPLTFTVSAAEAWTAEADSWLTLSRTSGEAGDTELTLTVGLNQTGAPRRGEVRIVTAATGLDAVVTVAQNARNSLYEDDGKALGYAYYSEDFAWIASYGGADCVGVGSQDGAKNIYSTGDALDVFKAAGLEDYNPVGKTIYACAGYLKMGKGSAQTGIVLPSLALAEGTSTDVELTFATCPNIGGGGSPDAVTITVEILEGPGGVNSVSGKLSDPIAPNPRWEWTPMSVKLYGVTAATRIVIRSTQQGDPGVTAGEKGLFRWYLDNVKIVKAPRN